MNQVPACFSSTSMQSKYGFYVNWIVKILATFLIVLFLFSGCSSKLSVEAVKPGVDPVTELKILRDEIETARSNDVHILSPTWYDKANTSYNSATGMHKKGEDKQAILERTARGRSQLKQAQNFTERARIELKTAYVARNNAISAEVPRLYSSEFDKVERRFLALAKDIENNNIDRARKNVAGIESVYSTLETRAIKEHTLGETRRLLDEAIKSDARKIAPKTLTVAQTTLQDTDQFITKHPHSSEEIQLRAGNALRTAQHLHVVLRQIGELAKTAPEDRLLAIEAKIIKVEKLATGSDEEVRVQTLEQHLHSVEESIKALLDSQQFLNAEISRLQLQMRESTKQMLSLGEEKQKRRAEREFSESVDRVRKLFSKSEAEVYQQGNELLIRLKGLNFEVGKSYILPEHFPILTKVQKSIRIFDTKNVVIEGHTDSTGTKATNDQLSRNRAVAVKAYLVNNNSVSKDRISAVGYGPEKPIAPNNTVRGRRLNRRIDILMTLQ